MLFGYLNDKKEFDAKDVEEVAREIFEETQDTSFVQAQRAPDHASGSGSDLANTPPDAGVQPRKVGRRQRQATTAGKELDASSREDMNHLLAGLNAWQFNERLGRLEQSLQQLELINGTTLSLLQKIVLSIVPDNEPSPTKPPSIVSDNEAPAEESSSIASDNETSSEKSSSISPGTRTKTKRSKLRNPRKASPRPASSGELPLNEPSIVPSIPSSNTTNT
jgi:hypothetical protein